MTERDIRKLETALAVAVPTAYRELLLNPPFTEVSCSYEDLCLDEVDSLIEDNMKFRAAVDGNPNLRPHERFLIIGSDHSEAFYILDLHGEALPVVEAGFGRRQEVFCTHPSFDAFLSHLQRSEQEAAEDDARAAAASPWVKRLIIAAFIAACLAYVAFMASKAL